VGYHLGHVLLRAPQDLHSPDAEALPVAHAAALLVAAGWPLPKGDVLAAPAVYHAVLVLRAWARQPLRAPADEALVAELMAPRATAAPHVGPGGMLPASREVSGAQVLKLGLQWMAAAGASGHAQRLARLLDAEEG
jgi:hypothetical protein